MSRTLLEPQEYSPAAAQVESKATSSLLASAKKDYLLKWQSEIPMLYERDMDLRNLP